MGCTSFNSLTVSAVCLLLVLQKVQCVIYFKKPTIHPSNNTRIAPTAQICVGHHPPGYNSSQLGRGPFNVSAEWWSHRYMSICIERTEFRTFFRGALVQVTYRGVPLGRLSSDFLESAHIHCPPGGQNTYYTYYNLKRKQAWYRWYPPKNFSYQNTSVEVHCTVIKEAGLYWRINVTSRYSEQLAEYSSEYDARYPLYDMSWALAKDGTPYHLRARWASRRKWAFRHGLYTSPEIFGYRNMMKSTLSENNTHGRPVLSTLLKLKTPTTYFSLLKKKNFTGQCLSSLKKILSPNRQPYWNRYVMGMSKFYYSGESASFQCP